MLHGLFPYDVVTAWGDPREAASPLFPEEEALVARAVPKRRREFAKGRECARAAMASLGLAKAPLLSGEGREPLWPAAVVGSITHTLSFCAAAVGRSERYRGIGIDAEPAEPLAPEIVRRICRADELERLPELGFVEHDVVPRLFFVAKEAVYKCLFPVHRRFLGFDDVRVVFADGTFRAEVVVTPPPFDADRHVRGRFRRAGAHLVAAAWIDRDDAGLR